MAKITATYGSTEAFVTSALMGLGATQQNPNGRFYLDGSMVNVELSQVIAEAIYIEEIFRNGQSVTDKYTVDGKAGAVRIMLDTAIPFTSRSLSFGGRKGTPGNGGVINKNPSLLPANDEFMIYLDQVNDQMMTFPDLGKEMIPLDIMAKKIAGYAKSVAQDRSASTLAEIIAYNIFRAMNDGGNLNQVADLRAENAYAELINELNSKMDDGDPVQNANTYPVEGRTFIGRPIFINGAFNRNSGIILLGGDLAQAMLKDYDLDASIGSRNYVGTSYKGYAMQFHFQSAPTYIWNLAELYLGLPKGSLDNVYSVACSAQANAVGKVVDLSVKMIDSPSPRGILAQPLNIWGHESFRKSQLIGNATLTNDYLVSLGFAEDERKYPIAPADLGANNDKIVVPIYDLNGVIIGYKEVAQINKPNGGNIQSGLPTVQNVTATPTDTNFTDTVNVTLVTATEGAKIYYTVDGSTPTESSTLYSAPIALTATTTIKALATKAGMLSSLFEITYTKVTVTKTK